MSRLLPGEAVGPSNRNPAIPRWANSPDEIMRCSDIEGDPVTTPDHTPGGDIGTAGDLLVWTVGDSTGTDPARRGKSGGKLRMIDE